MIGLITQAVGTAAEIAAGAIGTKNVTETHKTFSPDPISLRNAGLFGNQVASLNEQVHSNIIDENEKLKRGLMGTGQFTVALGGLMNMGTKQVKEPEPDEELVEEETA